MLIRKNNILLNLRNGIWLTGTLEIKTKAGFGKGGEKGESYGWAIAVYAKPEAIWGYEYVTSRYHEEPVDSWKAIAQHMMELYSDAEATAIKKLLGGSAATSVKTKKKNHEESQ